MTRLELPPGASDRFVLPKGKVSETLAALKSDWAPGVPRGNVVRAGGRQAGKTADFNAALAALMARPGARSSDPEFQKIRGSGFDQIWIDEDFGDFDMAAKPEAVSTEAIARLNELAGRMTDYFKAHKETVSLLSPGNLTVTMPGKGYSKANHIGGENFTFRRAYVGSAKAGSRLIFVFKPMAASVYTEMEMTENEAQAQLDGFRAAANLAAGGDFVAELKEVRLVENKAREAETVKEKFAEYPEFGAW